MDPDRTGRCLRRDLRGRADLPADDPGGDRDGDRPLGGRRSDLAGEGPAATANPAAILFDPISPAVVYAAVFAGAGGLEDGRRRRHLETSLRVPRARALWGDVSSCASSGGSPSGGIGVGYSMPLTPVAGAFWFWTPNNIELVVKVVDGREVNQQLWVFIASLSDVGYTVTVRDEMTGRVKTYVNPPGRLASIADTYAFY